MTGKKNISKQEKKTKKSKKTGKTLCKLQKKLDDKNALEEYIKLVNDGKYLCKKCGRVSNLKKNLCKGTSLLKG
jgi:hypothetical protein